MWCEHRSDKWSMAHPSINYYFFCDFQFEMNFWVTISRWELGMELTEASRSRDITCRVQVSIDQVNNMHYNEKWKWFGVFNYSHPIFNVFLCTTVVSACIIELRTHFSSTFSSSSPSSSLVLVFFLLSYFLSHSITNVCRIKWRIQFITKLVCRRIAFNYNTFLSLLWKSCNTLPHYYSCFSVPAHNHNVFRSTPMWKKRVENRIVFNAYLSTIIIILQPKI